MICGGKKKAYQRTVLQRGTKTKRKERRREIDRERYLLVIKDEPEQIFLRC